MSDLVLSTPKKSRLLKRIIIISSILVAVLIVGIMGFSAYVGYNLLHPEKEVCTAEEEATYPDHTDISFTLKGSDGVKIKGWWFDAETDKTVILCHGYGRSKTHFPPAMIKALMDNGYNVLDFDFRASGDSGGSLVTIGYKEKQDVLGAIDYVRLTRPGKIALLGWSMGASTSIIAGAESPHVNAVIADSPFANLSEYLDDQLPVWSKMPAFPFNTTILWSVKLMSGVDPDDVDPRDALEKLAPRPLMLIHSLIDPKIDYYDNSLDLLRHYDMIFRTTFMTDTSENRNQFDPVKAQGDKYELWTTTVDGHVKNYKELPDEYIQRVTSFLDRNLK